jgi:predicted acyl esterase
MISPPLLVDDALLSAVAPGLESILLFAPQQAPPIPASAIRRETLRVVMRDGIRLATDLYLPPDTPAPVIAVRTPYGRARLHDAFVWFARHGYSVVSQDCRGTGESEPDSWEYYVHEADDSFDLVDWLTRQAWCDGFLGSCGGSYIGETQWCMAVHPRMSTIVPEVAGLGVAVNTTRLYMYLNAYARSIGKGEGKLAIAQADLEREMLDETLAGGYFNDPLDRPPSEELVALYPGVRTLPAEDRKRWLWERYSALDGRGRADLIRCATGAKMITAAVIESLPAVFGQWVSHDAHILPFSRRTDLLQALHAPALMVTGWYDWGLNDALATWNALIRDAPEPVRRTSRLLIAPSAHNMPGYHEGREAHPELERAYRTVNTVDLLLNWYGAVRGGTTNAWPRVVYYLMGANEWHASPGWPPPGARAQALHLASGGQLTANPPSESSFPDHYTYDPDDATPTVGGSIVSTVYQPGSVDLGEVHRRRDVLTYTTAPLEQDVDVVGPLRLVLFASSSAVDTDLGGRLSDVFPDARAISLQSGMLRARFRDPTAPALLEPGRIYRFEIDLWATANRFAAGHRLRLDISSADFPRFDRNANLGGEPGRPVPAQQTIYHDVAHPSHLVVTVLGKGPRQGRLSSKTET